MNMNLERLWFERGETCLQIYMRCDKHDRDNARDKDILYATMAEIPHMLEDLRGESDYHPYYDDGCYLLKFWPGGARHLYTSSYIHGAGGKYTEHWYNFDGAWFATHLGRAFCTLSDGESYEVPAEDIETERKRLNPVVEWVFGEGVEAGIDEDIARTDIYVDNDGYVHDIQSCLSSVQRMAENRSNGQVITVKFWFDFGGNHSEDERPNVYYYEVYDGEKRLWNGGVVPSDYHDGLWRFSTHS